MRNKIEPRLIFKAPGVYWIFKSKKRKKKIEDKTHWVLEM
jgi:hypothetical protein